MELDGSELEGVPTGGTGVRGHLPLERAGRFRDHAPLVKAPGADRRRPGPRASRASRLMSWPRPAIPSPSSRRSSRSPGLRWLCSTVTRPLPQKAVAGRQRPERVGLHGVRGVGVRGVSSSTSSRTPPGWRAGRRRYLRRLATARSAPEAVSLSETVDDYPSGVGNPRAHTTLPELRTEPSVSFQLCVPLRLVPVASPVRRTP